MMMAVPASSSSSRALPACFSALLHFGTTRISRSVLALCLVVLFLSAPLASCSSASALFSDPRPLNASSSSLSLATSSSIVRGRSLRGLWNNGDIYLPGPNVWWSSEEGEIRVNDHPFHVKGIAWYGLETGHRTLQGLEYRNMDTYLSFLAAAGFNALRLPFSLRMALNLDETVRVIEKGDWWMTPRALIEMVVDKAAERGIVVLLDMHRADDDEKFGVWYTEKYTTDDLKRGWLNVLNHLKNKWNLMGVDLVNEPNGHATWGHGNPATDWNLAAQDLSLHIINHCPEFKGLFFVQGIGGFSREQHKSFWGGNLQGVWHAPLDLTFPEGNRRLVYSPHTYGPSVADQAYFHAPDYPHNMAAIWDSFFGFVEKRTGRALVLGEWGGPLAGANQQFEQALAKYLHERCMSDTFYWCLNPGSSDTGGLLRHDWITPMKRRLELLYRVQPNPSRLHRHNDGWSFRFSPGAHANPACARH